MHMCIYIYIYMLTHVQIYDILTNIYTVIILCMCKCMHIPEYMHACLFLMFGSGFG